MKTNKPMDVVSIEISKLVCRSYVRHAPSEDRILYFAELYESGKVALPPLEVYREDDGTYTLIDGRHRKEALDCLGKTHADCILITIKDPLERLIRSLAANIGGSKDMSLKEIKSFIMRLLDEGHKGAKISELLPFPKSMSRKLVREAQTLLSNARGQSAATAVKHDGLTVDQAAEKFKTSVEVVETIMKREECNSLLSNFGSAKGIFTNRYQGLTKRNNGSLKRIVQQFQEGNFTATQMEALIEHVAHQLALHSMSVKDWTERWKTLINCNRPVGVPVAVDRKAQELMQ